jgi:hypothetical protein
MSTGLHGNTFLTMKKKRSRGTHFYVQVSEGVEECTTPGAEKGSCHTLASCVQEEFVDDYQTFIKYFCSIGR